MIVALVTFWSLFSAATWLSCNAISGVLRIFTIASTIFFFFRGVGFDLRLACFMPNVIAAGIIAISHAMIVSVCRSHRAATFLAFQNSLQERWRCRSISFARSALCKQCLHSFPCRFVYDRLMYPFVCPIKMRHIALVMRIKSSAHRWPQTDVRRHFSLHDSAISSDILCDSIHPRPSCTIPSLGIAQISLSPLHRD